MTKNLSSGPPRGGFPRAWRSAVRATALAAAILAVVSACDQLSAARQRLRASAYVDTDSMGAAPSDVHSVRLHAPRDLRENSAAAMSARQPGVFFTINDSGNEPLLFALDTTGSDRGVWRVLDVMNVDWEAASIGPCATASSGSSAADTCVYVGDVGDNGASDAERAIHRVREPTAIAGRDSVRAESLRFKYADRPHDVEAMYVAPTGELLLITKRRLRDTTSRSRPALIFSLPPSAWKEPGVATAQLVDSLPIVPGSAPLRSITDAALSFDARHLAVRTYAQVYVFATDPMTGRVDHAVSPATCNIVPLDEPQGEGITWVNDRGRLLLTSEGLRAPLRLVNCPLP